MGPGVDLGSILEARGHLFRSLGAIFGDLGGILEHQKTSRILKSEKNERGAPIRQPGGLRRATGGWGALQNQAQT